MFIKFSRGGRSQSNVEADLRCQRSQRKGYRGGDEHGDFWAGGAQGLLCISIWRLATRVCSACKKFIKLYA